MLPEIDSNYSTHFIQKLVIFGETILVMKTLIILNKTWIVSNDLEMLSRNRTIFRNTLDNNDTKLDFNYDSSHLKGVPNYWAWIKLFWFE